MRKQILFLLLVISTGSSFAQGTLSGDLMTNLNFFRKDTKIGASGNPLYDNKLSGSDAWFTLRYAVSGYTFFVRADAFDNSNLKNLTASSTDFGIGAWSISKDINDLSITVGSIYDQFGSGILFRSYENRGLLIDNAVMGLELKYQVSDNFSVKGFTGQLKNNNGDDNLINNVRYGPVLKGLNGEGDVSFGQVSLTPGFGVLNRTLDAASMNSIALSINAQDTSNRFLPKYNMYAFSLYNSLIYKNLFWYAEGVYKTHEAILDNILVDKPGSTLYTSLNYGIKGLALSLMGRRTEDFEMRTSPNELQLKGMLNWQPIIAVLRPLRLVSRYSPPAQNLSEMAGTANLTITPNDETMINLTYSHINNLKGDKLYREVYAEGTYQGIEDWIIDGGVQYLEYNLLTYRGAGGAVANAPILYAVTPFAEFTHKIDSKKSIRFEAQYMFAKQDYGSWAFALIEYNIVPTWSFAISDMYNTVPNPNDDNPNYQNPGSHFYNVFTAFTKGPNRFTIAYVKQIEGINCTGGVCRFEPAFSGIKASLNTSF